MDISPYKPTERFSSVIDFYDRYRPGYPIQVADILKNIYGLKTDSLIADMGSGTGIFTGLLLQNKCQVIAVEPNNDMRGIAEKKLSGFSNFKSLKGSAEDVPDIKDGSIDLITCAQSFHWFDYSKAIPEFNRILKSNGKIALIWNDRANSGNGLMEKYETILKRYCDSYSEVNNKRLSFEAIKTIFPNNKLNIHYADNYQDMDLEGIIGRLRSSSYCPKEDNKNYIPLLEEVKNLFFEFQSEGLVRFLYNTCIYVIEY